MACIKYNFMVWECVKCGKVIIYTKNEKVTECLCGGELWNIKDNVTLDSKVVRSICYRTNKSIGVNNG